MLKKLTQFVILSVALGLFAVFFIINNTGSVKPRAEFDINAAAVGTSQLQTFYRARILEVLKEDKTEDVHLTRVVQTVKVRFLSGALKGQEVEIDNETFSAAQALKTGQTVVVAEVPDQQSNNGNPYVIVDQYRLLYLAIFLAVFLLLAIIFGRWRGVTAVVGLGFSIFVLLYFIAPHILQGQNPILVTLVGSGIIAVVSIFLAHGFNQRTRLAVISTLVTLGLAQGLAYVAVHYVRLLGNGSEEAFLLQAGSLGAFNLQGLLLAGIIIGTLGILDDVTTAQSAAVAEIHQTDSNLSFKQLYSKGMAIGREHIASLINTLVLAYAGAFFPLFLLIILSNNQPLWTIINSEFMAEEIVRTLVGSIALIVAVPLSTLLAAYYFRRD